MPVENFYNYPDYLIVKLWSGVRESKNRQVNTDSYTTAQLSALFYNYILAKSSEDTPTETMNFKDFLPFEIKAKHEDAISVETAKIIMEAIKAGLMPGRIQKAIIDVPDLYETICSQARK